MKSHIILIISVLLLFSSACKSNEQPTDGTDPTNNTEENNNSDSTSNHGTVNVIITGDRSRTLNGIQGGLGSAWFEDGVLKRAVFGFSDGDEPSIIGSAILENVKLSSREEQVFSGGILCNVDWNPQADEMKLSDKFSTGYYPYFYKIQPDSAECKFYLTITGVDEFKDKLGTTYARVQGKFHFQASNTTIDSGLLIDAMTHNPNPPYDAAKCGISKIEVRGEFRDSEIILNTSLSQH